MNKYRIKIFLMICIILLVGCNKAETPQMNTETRPPIELKSAVPIRLYTNKCSNTVIASDALANEIYGSDYHSDWQQLLLEKYNLEIKLHVIEISDFTFTEEIKPFDYMKDYDIVINDNGRIFSESFSNYTKLNLIQPFNDFLENSVAWDSLPTEFTSTFKDAKGNIWAIPYSDSIKVFARVINQQWLKNLGLAAPNSVDELYEMLKSFTYKDPDKNGIDDTYGLSVSRYNLSLISFKDIFEANGCYLTYQYIKNANQPIRYFAVPIGFNPESERIENNSLGNGFKESLDLISNMINENIINVESNNVNVGTNNSGDGYFSNPQVGTYYGIIEDNFVYPNQYDYIFALDGINHSKTSSAFRDSEGAYFLSSYANEPEKLVPAFIETFYTSEDGFILGRYGLIGEQYKYSSNSNGLEVNTQYVDKDWNIQIVGDLSWHDVDVFYNGDALNNAEKIDTYNLFLDNRMFMLSQKHMSFGAKLFEELPDSTVLGDNYQARFSNIFRQFILGEINTEDVLNELEKTNKLFGIDEWIEEVNKQWFNN